MKLSDIGAINDMPRGWATKSTLNIKIYYMWQNIFKRCYYKKLYVDKGLYLPYKGCSVNSEFFLLSNFVKWIEQEPNYHEFCETCSTIKWSIDKDGIISGNKEYAPGKIRLVTLADNEREQFFRNGNPAKSKVVIGINLTNNVCKVYQRRGDVKSDNFDPGAVGRVCKGISTQHKGCKWFYATDLLGLMNFLYKGVLK